MADIFDVLADSTRRQLLATLHERRVQDAANDELTVSELVERLGLSQPTVSKHLQKLREHGLVSVRTEGQHHRYRLEAEPLRAVERWVSDFLADTEGPTLGSGAFAAWSGAEVGESLGRRLADGTHQARAAAASASERVATASEKVANRLPRIGRKNAEDKA